MSDLFYQNDSNKCQGWTNPSSLFYGPQILSLSSFQSPAGSTSLVSINGTNFYSYSSISFGTYKPTVYFINSNIIQFYVPSTLNSGTFTIQVFNGSVASNPVNYTIDNASGYWLLNSNNNITNTNTGGTVVSWLSRGTPTIIPLNTSTYTILNTDNWIICNTSSTIISIILPTGSNYIGRELTFKNISSTAVNTTMSVISSDGITTTNTILSGVGWVTLVYNGYIWIIIQSS